MDDKDRIIAELRKENEELRRLLAELKDQWARVTKTVGVLA